MMLKLIIIGILIISDDFAVIELQFLLKRWKFNYS